MYQYTEKKFKKIILVTGCAGFIGSHLLKILSWKYSNYLFIGYDKLTYCGKVENIEECLDYDNVRFIVGDICDRKNLDFLFKYHHITDVIHLAAESHVDNSIKNPLEFVQTNVMGTCTLLDIARTYWKNDYNNHRFYHVSTDEVYGSLEFTDKPFTEENKYNPHSPYSASKAASDHFVRAYHDTYGMNVVISNCSNNYGSHQYPEKLIPLVIDKLKNRKSIPIYGKGENVRDWLFVEDHIDAIDKIFHFGKNGETYNIGGNNEMSNINLVNLICNIYDNLVGNNKGESNRLITFVEDRKGHDLRYAIDSTKLQKELGWVPSSPMDKLVETVKYYINNE